MIVNVTEVDLPPFTSVGVATGTDEAGNTVRFGIDHRPAAGLIDLLAEEGEVACEVEEWQILQRDPATHWINQSGGFAMCGVALSATLPSTTQGPLVTCPKCAEIRDRG